MQEIERAKREGEIGREREPNKITNQQNEMYKYTTRTEKARED